MGAITMSQCELGTSHGHGEEAKQKEKILSSSWRLCGRFKRATDVVLPPFSQNFLRHLIAETSSRHYFRHNSTYSIASFWRQAWQLAMDHGL